MHLHASGASRSCAAPDISNLKILSNSGRSGMQHSVGGMQTSWASKRTSSKESALACSPLAGLNWIGALCLHRTTVPSLQPAANRLHRSWSTPPCSSLRPADLLLQHIGDQARHNTLRESSSCSHWSLGMNSTSAGACRTALSRDERSNLRPVTLCIAAVSSQAGQLWSFLMQAHHAQCNTWSCVTCQSTTVVCARGSATFEGQPLPSTARHL